MKSTRSTTMFLALCAGLFVTLAALPGRAGEFSQVLTAGHVVTEDNPYHLALVRLDELLRERTNDRISLEIYPNTQLGNERDLVEGIQMGTVDMMVTSTAALSGFTDDFNILDMPYLFMSKQHARKVMDSDVGNAMLASLPNNGIVGLCIWENGFRSFHNSVKVVKSPKDTVNMKIRILESPIYLDTFVAFGSNPMPMAWSEVYTACQTKTIDGLEGTIVNSYLGKLHEVAPYFTVSMQFYSAAPLIMSKLTWDKIPPEDQEIIRQAAMEVTAYQREKADQAEINARENLVKEGATITEVDLNEWRDAVKPVYEKHKFDQKILDAIAAME